MNAVALPRSVLIYAVVLPLALVLGYVLATPDTTKSLLLVGLLAGTLSIPALLRWHYPVLVFSWNASVILAFFPGRPSLWMLFAGISLGIAILNCVLDKRLQFQHVPSITWPLLTLLAIVVITAKLTGGIGLRALGSSTYGGRKFVFIVAAVIGYFALSSQTIDWRRARTLTSVYFLSGLTGLIANLIYLAGPAFYILYWVISVDGALPHALEDMAIGSLDPKMARMPGAMLAGSSGICYLMLRYGIRGLVDMQKPWRLLLAVALFGLSLLGGYRSALVSTGLLFVVQFYFERLYRTRLAIAIVVGLLVGGALLVPMAKHLPLSVQRSVSFLPLDVDANARAQALGSLQWRLDMWQMLVPQIPQYFWIGKGYAIDPTDLYFAEESARRGVVREYEVSVVAGDYHSGPLSILMPFGIFGLLAFLWFIVASIRLLYRNHRVSDPNLQVINTFLLSYFVARVIFYFFAFGALHNDLQALVGIVGLSIAINGGLRNRTSNSGAAHPVPEAVT